MLFRSSVIPAVHHLVLVLERLRQEQLHVIVGELVVVTERSDPCALSHLHRLVVGHGPGSQPAQIRVRLVRAPNRECGLSALYQVT